MNIDNERRKPVSSKGSFIWTIAQTGQHIPRPLLQKLWNTSWNEIQLLRPPDNLKVSSQGWKWGGWVGVCDDKRAHFLQMVIIHQSQCLWRN